jgi:hypothetical protein
MIGVLALAGCNGGGAGGDTSGGEDGQVVLTVRGTPSVVTDTVRSELTAEEVTQIADACIPQAGVPGVSGLCRDLVEARREPCKPSSLFCITGRRFLDNPEVGVLQLSDKTTGAKRCADDATVLCAGITVPAELVDSLTTTASTNPPATTPPATTPPATKPPATKPPATTPAVKASPPATPPLSPAVSPSVATS